MHKPQPSMAADTSSRLLSREVEAGGNDRAVARRRCGWSRCSPHLHAIGGPELGLSLVLLPSHPRAPQHHSPHHLPRRAVLKEDSSAFYKVPAQRGPPPVELPHRCPPGTGGPQLPVMGRGTWAPGLQHWSPSAARQWVKTLRHWGFKPQLCLEKPRARGRPPLSSVSPRL